MYKQLLDIIRFAPTIHLYDLPNRHLPNNILHADTEDL